MKSMENYNLKTLWSLFIIMLFFVWGFSLTSHALYEDAGTSWVKECEIKAVWNEYDGAYKETNYVPIWCNNSITSVKNLWPTIPDWEYRYTIRKKDNYDNVWETQLIDYTNVEWVSRLDTMAPVCELQEINIDDTNFSHYYHESNTSWELYYRKDWTTQHQVKVRFNIELDDKWTYPQDAWRTPVEQFVSKGKEFDHPLVLAEPLSGTTIVETKDIDLNIAWNSDLNTTLFLNQFTCKDNAWNSRNITVKPGAKIYINGQELWEVTLAYGMKIIPDSTDPSFDPQKTFWIETKRHGKKYFNEYYEWTDAVVASDTKKFYIPLFNETGSGLWENNFKIENKFAWWESISTTQPSWYYPNQKLITYQNSPSEVEFEADIRVWECDNSWCTQYAWTYNSPIFWDDKICDMVWNCVDITTPHLNVISDTVASYDITMVSDWSLVQADADDIYTVRLENIKDRFWNNVNFVSWVKRFELDMYGTSHLKLNMLSRAWENWEVVYIDWIQKLYNQNSDYYHDSNRDINDFLVEMKSYVPSDYTYGSTHYVNRWYYFDSLRFRSTCIDNTKNLDCWDWDVNLTVADVLWDERQIKFSKAFSIGDLENEIAPLAEWVEKRMTFYSEFEEQVNTDKFSEIWLQAQVASSWGTVIKDEYIEIRSLWKKWPVKSFSEDWIYHMWDASYKSTFAISDDIFLPILKEDIDQKPASRKEMNFIFTVVKLFNNNNQKYSATSKFYYLLDWSRWPKRVIMPWFVSWMTLEQFEEVAQDPTVNIWDATANADAPVIESDNSIDIEWIAQWDNNAWDLSEISIYDIKTDIHKSVELLTRWFDTNSATNSGARFVMSDLSNFSSVDSKFKVNNNVLYFKDTDLEFDCSWNCKLSWERTIIVDWWDIYLKSDMYYEDPSDIFGLIILNPNLDGKWNLYIDENISNGVWIVYGEWSVMQINSSENIYWTKNTPKNENLNNWLLWYWALATRNTINVDTQVLAWNKVLEDLDWNIWSERTYLEKLCPYWTKWYEDNTCYENYRAIDLAEQRNHSMISDEMWGEVPFSIKAWFVDTVKAWWYIFNKYVSWGKVWAHISENTPLRKASNLNAPIQIDFDPRTTVSPPPWFTNQ